MQLAERPQPEILASLESQHSPQQILRAKIRGEARGGVKVERRNEQYLYSATEPDNRNKDVAGLKSLV